MTGESLQPSITIDFKGKRLRFHKKTLHCLGNPEYILFFINPHARTFIVQRGERFDLRSYRLPWTQLKYAHYIEIRNMSLMNILLKLSTHWTGNQSYRIYGIFIQDEEIIKFNIMESIVTCETWRTQNDNS